MSDDAATLEHFARPQVGDRFHEMYSFWIHVEAIVDEAIYVQEYAGNSDPRPRAFANWEEWRKAYSYSSMNKPFVCWRDNLLQKEQEEESHAQS